jgi:transposase
MKQLKEVARLRFGLKRSHSEIAVSLGIARSTVQEVVKRFQDAGLTWPLAPEFDDDSLYARLYPAKASPLACVLPDFSALARELKGKGVTKKQLWREYAQAQGSSALGYTQFCVRFAEYAKGADPVMRLAHLPGDKLFVDYAGMTMNVIERGTGEVRRAQIFVAALGYSHAIYAEASWTQSIADWLGAHCRALAFYGGVPQALVPDNLKTGITHACRYEPVLQDSYREWAAHYGCAILPARVRAPDDKAKVENAVRLVEQSVLAPLRHQQFFSLAELNSAINDGLARLNARPFTKREGSRALALAEERQHLKALPTTPFQYGVWKRAKVHVDYHIEIERRYYSVPHALIGKTVDVRQSERLVEVYDKGCLAAAHPKLQKAGSFSTTAEHMPERHRAFADRSQVNLQRRAQAIGVATAAIIAAQLERRVHVEQTYRSSLGILRLAKDYSDQALEGACARALELKLYSYRAIRNLIQTPASPPPTVTPPRPIEHDNVRGQAYYGGQHAH